MFEFLKNKYFFLNRREGFALLYAILLSGAVLTVGVILMNIITKQIIFSSLNRESETTYYYLANSGRECLLDYASNGEGFFYSTIFNEDTESKEITFEDSATIKCSLAVSNDNPDGDIVLIRDESSANEFPTYKVSGHTISDNGINRKLDLLVTFNSDCISKGNCSGDDLIDKSVAILVADGYSGSSGGRTVKRSAPSVVKPL